MDQANHCSTNMTPFSTLNTQSFDIIVVNIDITDFYVIFSSSVQHENIYYYNDPNECEISKLTPYLTINNYPNPNPCHMS